MNRRRTTQLPIESEAEAWRWLGKQYERHTDFVRLADGRVMGVCGACLELRLTTSRWATAWMDDHLANVYGMDNRENLYWWPTSAGNSHSFTDRAVACYLMAELVEDQNDVLRSTTFPLPPLTTESEE